jgi:hypothetical protein
MCLLTQQSKPIIITKDLIVYKDVKKVEEDIYISSHEGFKWKKGVLEQRCLFVCTCDPQTSSSLDYITNNYYFNKNKVLSISIGLHAYCDKERPSHLFGKLKEFLIPKGSEVYYDATGLIVSNQMMML